MKIFKHTTHTAYQLKKYQPTKNRRGIVFIKETGNKHSIKALLQIWKWYIEKNQNNVFVIIRTPFFKIEHDNGGLQIGHPNFYLWVIK